jgi:hypothetical protein
VYTNFSARAVVRLRRLGHAPQACPPRFPHRNSNSVSSRRACRSLCGSRGHNHAQRGGKVNNRVALKYVETRSNPPRPRATAAPPKSSPTRVFHHHSKSDLPHLPGTKHTLEPIPCTTSFKMATKTEEKPVGMLIFPHKLLQIATYIIGQTTRSPTPTRELPPTYHTPPKESKH